MNLQPVETTLYSLSELPPAPTAPDRRVGERHMTIYRVGSLLIGDRRELCLIKNISAGGMMVRAYSPIARGTPLSVELKQGQPIAGRANWSRDANVGISFDQPIDVIDILATVEDGRRPRMPRIELPNLVIVRDGARIHRTRACDISQGGIKVRAPVALAPDTDVVVSLAGFEPLKAVVRWCEGDLVGISFNQVLTLTRLVGWLQQQRDGARMAG